MPRIDSYKTDGLFEENDSLSGIKAGQGFKYFNTTAINNFLRKYFVKVLTDVREENASFSLTRDDNNTYIRYTGTNNIDVVTPSTVSAGWSVEINQIGQGVVTILPGTGASINGPTSTDGGSLEIICVANALFDSRKKQ